MFLLIILVIFLAISFMIALVFFAAIVIAGRQNDISNGQLIEHTLDEEAQKTTQPLTPNPPSTHRSTQLSR